MQEFVSKILCTEEVPGLSSHGGEKWAVVTVVTLEFSLAHVNVHPCRNSHLPDASPSGISLFDTSTWWEDTLVRGSLVPLMRPGPVWHGVWPSGLWDEVDEVSGLMASLRTTQDSRLCKMARFHFQWLILVFSSTKQNNPLPKCHPSLFFPQHLKNLWYFCCL